jgi:exodeoxyribonuclease III
VILQSWNIQAGGGTRIAAIMTSISRHAADTVVLGETTATRLPELSASLRKLGFTSIHAPRPPERKRGILIASKRPFEVREPSAKASVETHRWVEAWFPEERLGLAGIYFPDTAKPIAALWPRVHEAALRRRDEPFLLVGDLNSGHGAFDTDGADLSSDPWFTAMPFHGMVDLWRHKNRHARQFTWYSNHRGKRRGFRLDHAFGTAALRRRVRRVWYSHDERRAGTSDHSALLVSIR